MKKQSKFVSVPDYLPDICMILLGVENSSNKSILPIRLYNNTQKNIQTNYIFNKLFRIVTY